MEPNSPAITGIEHVRPHFKKTFEQFKYDSYVYGDSEVQVTGDWAFYRGNYTVALAPKEGGPTTHFDGKWLDICARQISRMKVRLH